MGDLSILKFSLRTNVKNIVSNKRLKFSNFRIASRLNTPVTNFESPNNLELNF